MPEGGQLTIETADVVLDEGYQRDHAEAHAGPHVVLAVSDNGHGIDRETQQRLFEPFFTTKPLGQGTGLGLATVLGIVAQSGGHICVYSEVGLGTTFKIYLPRTNERIDAAHAEVTPNRIAPGTETILLVEDETLVRDFIQRVLRRQGYTVHPMKDPAEAMEFSRSHSARIDAVLTDVVLPGMNGRALAAHLQREHPESRVLFMSGYTDHAIVHNGILDPSMRFLQKPFTPAALLKKIKEVLMEAQEGQGTSV
jgi:CheY-like chemotaxis protein